MVKEIHYLDGKFTLDFYNHRDIFISYMKQLYIMIVALLGLLAIDATAFATPTVTLYQNSMSAGSGGQFTAVTSDNGTFQTFCVDVNHEFTPGTTYNYTVGNQTYMGSGDYLSVGTAYLYSQFLNGNLAGYNYSDPNSAGSLQNVIWSLQNETFGNSQASFVAGNPFYNDVVIQFGNIVNAELPAGGTYGVDVMNLYDVNCNQVQSQLVLVPEHGSLFVSLFLLIPLVASNKRFYAR